jgi:two-component system, response regulator PdtaR
MITSRRAVVADDDRDTREFLQEALARQGWAVEAASTGEGLVEACRRAMPQLVVADVRMPGMDGVDALAAVNAIWTVPFVLASAHHDEALLARMEGVPVLGFLVKPFTEAQLKAAVAVAQARYRQLAAMRKEALDLGQALADRKLVERAKGVLMRLLRVDEDEAFRRLRETASSKNLKMIEAAQRLIAAEGVLSEFDGR